MSDDTGGEETEPNGAELNEAVAAFLAGADDVYGEYDQGYIDADAALSVLSSRIDDLRDATENTE
ncbi:hypothetical protein [Halobaculum gomorrense]|uniref:Uncharacterized protein n=1 Tax=Halobaculum gomorrense TaxID=43928 RepID=A0A1M5RH15_9EURY|nr:hypothetical protein [Halobaculum gomorrense]SHH25544.1 hypothetical protein SAMN05443636_2192 [Halobaculum gomorrense]